MFKCAGLEGEVSVVAGEPRKPVQRRELLALVPARGVDGVPHLRPNRVARVAEAGDGAGRGENVQRGDLF